MLTEDDIMEIYAVCRLQLLKGQVAGLSTKEEVNEMPGKVLAYLREHCTTDY